MNRRCPSTGPTNRNSKKKNHTRHSEMRIIRMIYFAGYLDPLPAVCRRHYETDKWRVTSAEWWVLTTDDVGRDALMLWRRTTRHRRPSYPVVGYRTPARPWARPAGASAAQKRLIIITISRYRPSCFRQVAGTRLRWWSWWWKWRWLRFVTAAQYYYFITI